MGSLCLNPGTRQSTNQSGMGSKWGDRNFLLAANFGLKQTEHPESQLLVGVIGDCHFCAEQIMKCDQAQHTATGSIGEDDDTGS